MAIIFVNRLIRIEHRSYFLRFIMQLRVAMMGIIICIFSILTFNLPKFSNYLLTPLQKGRKGFTKSKNFNLMKPCLEKIHNTYNQ